MKGFREQKQGSKNDVLRNLQVEVQNNQMALRMSQMLMKRILDDSNNMGKDLGLALGQLTDMQYKFNAVINTLSIDPAKIAEAANALRLSDFETAATKADQEDNLVPADNVTDESTIIITSTTDGPLDSGIFRSRIKVAEAGVPALLKGLLDQPVGTKIDIEMAGKIHHVELLSIMNPIKPQETPIDTVQLNVATQN